LPVLDEVDPRADLPAVFDQGQLGSCTANAVAAAVEYDAKLGGADPGFLSRLWIYYYERQLEGAPADQDTGAYGRDGFKVCQKLGVPLESDWPYDTSSSPTTRPRPSTPRRSSTVSPTTRRFRGTSTR
jgi:C1A family cysteine protease